MQRNIHRFGDRFARRILSASEYEDYCRAGQPAHFLAKRFAAKEATVKAMGTGFSLGITLKQISVDHDAAGKPELVLTGDAKAFLESNDISIADEQDHAVAFVTLSIS